MSEIEPVYAPDIVDGAIPPGTEGVYSVEAAWNRVDAGKQEAHPVDCELRVRFQLPVAQHFDTDGCLDRIAAGVAALLAQVARQVSTATGRNPLQ